MVSNIIQSPLDSREKVKTRRRFHRQILAVQLFAYPPSARFCNDHLIHWSDKGRKPRIFLNPPGWLPCVVWYPLLVNSSFNPLGVSIYYRFGLVMCSANQSSGLVVGGSLWPRDIIPSPSWQFLKITYPKWVSQIRLWRGAPLYLESIRLPLLGCMGPRNSRSRSNSAHRSKFRKFRLFLADMK